MAEGETFPEDMWLETKVLVGQLVNHKLYDKARGLLHDCHVGFLHPPKREGEIIGMLLIIDIVSPPERAKGGEG